ncbi:MAG: OmpA family protein [Candidatus Solibacter usitatus]|nr:OmpA family protein [Candidatus Solibacter usitatus]
MRRGRKAEHVNHERWLVSYADFITLLFAFFVMMYANSQTNKEKAQQISQAFREALDQGRVSQALSRLLKSEKAPHSEEREAAAELVKVEGAKTVELAPALKELNVKLKDEIAANRVEVRMEKRGLVISLREATFFPPGGDTLEPGTVPVLEVIAKEIRGLPNPVRLEGHTDSVPIRTSRFKSNWELSAARGIAMLELFAERFGVEQRRMAIGGFADSAPVASNETAEGRARNRRVDIVLLNEVAAAREPGANPPGR